MSLHFIRKNGNMLGGRLEREMRSEGWEQKGSSVGLLVEWLVGRLLVDLVMLLYDPLSARAMPYLQGY